MLSLTIPLYKDRQDVTLTTYIQDDADKMLKSPRPAVLICPGGGYLKCATQEGEPVALRFAAMGYQTFILRYSTYFGGMNPQQLADCAEQILPIKNTIYPNSMLEVGMAMKLIYEHAQEWHVDIKRIALCGFSAGAHNVAMYAAKWQEPWIGKHIQIENEKIKPAAVILGYIAGDYFFNTEEPHHILQTYSNMAMFGKTKLEKEDVEKVQPSKYITGDMPPAFLWATYEDTVVSVKNTIAMAEKLAEQKIPFELHIFEKGDHGLSLGMQESAKKKEQIRRDVSMWVPMAEIWLEKRFALEF